MKQKKAKPGPYDGALSLLKGAMIGIRGHAPEGEKKERNLRGMFNAIRLLEAAGRVEVSKNSTFYGKDIVYSFKYDEMGPTAQALLRAIYEAREGGK